MYVAACVSIANIKTSSEFIYEQLANYMLAYKGGILFCWSLSYMAALLAKEIN